MQASRTQLANTVGPSERALQVVGREQYRPPTLSQQFDEFGQSFQAFSVEAGIRLIENHNRRIVQQRSCDGQPLRHSPAVGPHGVIPSFPKSQQFKQLFDSACRLIQIVHAGVELQVLGAGEPIVQQRRMSDHTDISANLMGSGKERNRSQPHLTLIRFVQSCNDPQ